MWPLSRDIGPYAARRGQVDAWYVCNRAYSSRGEPHCQTIAGWPVDEVIGDLMAAEMTPHAVELALEIRKKVEARYDEADRLRGVPSNTLGSMPSLHSVGSYWLSPAIASLPIH